MRCICSQRMPWLKNNEMQPIDTMAVLKTLIGIYIYITSVKTSYIYIVRT